MPTLNYLSHVFFQNYGVLEGHEVEEYGYADKKCQVQRTKCKKTGQSVGEITEN